MSFTPLDTVTEGGQNKALVSDSVGRDLMRRILLELRKMNLHMQLMTDEDIKESDLDES